MLARWDPFRDLVSIQKRAEPGEEAKPKKITIKATG